MQPAENLGSSLAVSTDVVMADAPETSYAVLSLDGAKEEQDRHAPPSVRVAIDNAVESATSVDEEDFYSPGPEAGDPSVTATQSYAEEAEVRSPSEEGEVAMSESSTDDEEEEYVPDEPQPVNTPVPAPAHVSANAAAEVASFGSPSKSPRSMSSTEDEDEVYEPPEPSQHEPDVQIGEFRPPGSHPNSIGADDQGEMDISTVSSDDSDTALQPSLDNELRGSISFNRTSPFGLSVADDLAPDLQDQRPATVASIVEPVRSRPPTLPH
jgi:hypothetical protein